MTGVWQVMQTEVQALLADYLQVGPGVDMQSAARNGLLMSD